MNKQIHMHYGSSLSNRKSVCGSKSQKSLGSFHQSSAKEYRFMEETIAGMYIINQSSFSAPSHFHLFFIRHIIGFLVQHISHDHFHNNR